MKKLLLIILLLFITATSYSQIAPFGYWKSSVVASSNEAQADSLFARMTSAGSTPSANRKSLINTTIKMLKDSLNITSLYPAFDLFYVFSARDTLQARLNWVNSSYTIAGIRMNNAGDFVADSGYKGDVGNERFLKTGYIPNTNKVTFAYNSSSIGGWITIGYLSESYSIWGVYSDSWSRAEQFIQSGFSAEIRVRSHTYTQYTTFNGGAYRGLFHVQTPDADSIIVYNNGIWKCGVKRGSSATDALPTKDIWILARNNEGSGDNFSPERICFFYLGKKFTPLEIRKIYNTIKYYLDNAPSNT